MAKLYTKLVDDCLKCPHLSIANIVSKDGVWVGERELICNATDDRRRILIVPAFPETVRIPEWCPLPDAEEA